MDYSLGPLGSRDRRRAGALGRPDPCPQAGTYRLASPKGRSPKGRSLEMSFRRVDSDTIAVKLSSGGRSFEFNVNSIGAVADKS